MIVPMSLVRVLAPRRLLERVLSVLQDVGLFHPAEGEVGLEPAADEQDLARESAELGAVVADVEAALETLGVDPAASGPQPASAFAPADIDRRRGDAREAREARQAAETIATRLAGARAERSRLAGQAELIGAFAPVLDHGPSLPLAAFHVVLRPGEESAEGRLQEALERALGAEFSLHRCRLPSGGLALMILVSASSARRVDSLLARAEVRESPVAREYGATLAEALPRMRERLAALPREIAAAEGELARLARTLAPDLLAARLGLRDALARLEARRLARGTSRAIVLEGWLPTAAVPRLEKDLLAGVGSELAFEVVSTEGWCASDAPVVLSNPRLFRPFETLTNLLPLPVYGSIDPTPYVAVFFPMFFGLMLGDVGHGAALALIALVLRLRSREGSMLRSIAEIAGACALFTIVFGLLYGEFLGDLGSRAFGLQPMLFDREEALMPFLVLALGIGVVHVLLGLLLAAISALRGPRDKKKALGAGLQIAIVSIVILSLLAAFEVLPRGLLTPATITLLILFPILVFVEGVLAPVRLLSTLSHVLSYARIMAIGTASVMLAVVANRMAGALGGALVGVVFALLFHLVNFALGILGPALHGLRLHWVEFFGEFYSPGGVRYTPLQHWVSGSGAHGGPS